MPTDKIRIAVRKYDPFEVALKKIWDSFYECSGCKIGLDIVPMDLHELYDAALGKEQGLKRGLWDIAHINTDWITEAYYDDAVCNLRDFIVDTPPNGYPDAWTTSLLEAQNFEKDVFGLPFHNGPECLIYRKDIFENEKEQNLFQEQTGNLLLPPETWEDFCQIAEFFHRPQDNLYGTTFAAFPDGHNTVFDFCIQLWSRGGELVTPEGKVQIYSPQAIEGLRFYADALGKNHFIHPLSLEFDSVKTGLAFASGEVAMMVNWFGFASMCEVVESSKVKGKVGIADIPHSRNTVPISLNAYWMYCIGSGSKFKDLAYDFISYAVNTENDKLLTLEGGIGCRKSTWNDKEVNKIIPYFHKLETLHSNTRMLPRMQNWFKISEIIDSVVTQSIRDAGNIAHILKKGQEQIAALP